MRQALVLVGLVLLPALAFAHPQHVSTTEVDVRRERGVLEVAMKVRLTDLQAALKIYETEPIDVFAKTEATAKALTRYVEEKLRVRAGKAQWPIRWLGHQVTPRGTWLYFEVVAPRNGWTGATLHNGVFFELEETQINVLTLRNGKNKRTVSFTFGSKPIPI